MASVQSPNNPFRDPSRLTPNVTGASAQTTQTLVPPPLPARRPSTTSTPTPTSSSPPPLPARRPSDTTAAAVPAPVDSSDASFLNEELPPPYSAGPDFHQGETTLEYGPLRPGQQARPAPTPSTSYQQPNTPRPAPQTTGWQSASRPSPLSTWQNLAVQLTGQVNEIVNARRAPSLSTYPGQRVRSMNTGYAPPPGPPPGRPNSDFYRPEPGPSYHPPPGPRPQSAPPTPDANHGRPTTRPTPGHALIHDGQILIYPETFECSKCHNTGFKHFDPRRPCHKCWKKYGKAYTGALQYVDFSSDRPDTGKVFQKPLPAGVNPPQHPIHHNQGYQPPPLPPQPSIRPLTRYQHAPANATVLPPGDPRLGGRQCPGCGGRGREAPRGLLELMFDDDTTCRMCRGIGRVFN